MLQKINSEEKTPQNENTHIQGCFLQGLFAVE